MILELSSMKSWLGEPIKAWEPMRLRPTGRLVSARDLQRENAKFPMLPRLSGKERNARDVQSLNV